MNMTPRFCTVKGYRMDESGFALSSTDPRKRKHTLVLMVGRVAVTLPRNVPLPCLHISTTSEYHYTFTSVIKYDSSHCSDLTTPARFAESTQPSPENPKTDPCTTDTTSLLKKYSERLRKGLGKIRTPKDPLVITTVTLPRQTFLP